VVPGGLARPPSVVRSTPQPPISPSLPMDDPFLLIRLRDLFFVARPTVDASAMVDRMGLRHLPMRHEEECSMTHEEGANLKGRVQATGFTGWMRAGASLDVHLAIRRMRGVEDLAGLGTEGRARRQLRPGRRTVSIGRLQARAGRRVVVRAGDT
jgi:hypothetical protein